MLRDGCKAGSQIGRNELKMCDLSEARVKLG